MRYVRILALALLAVLVGVTPVAADHWSSVHWETQPGQTKQLYVVDPSCDPDVREWILYAARGWNDWQDFVQIDIVDPGGCMPENAPCPFDTIWIWICPGRGLPHYAYASPSIDSNGHMQGAFIVYDNDYRWRNSTFWKNLMIHEVGHTIGFIKHNEQEANSVMNPVIPGWQGQIISRHDLDVISANYCHGQGYCAPGTR